MVSGLRESILSAVEEELELSKDEVEANMVDNGVCVRTLEPVHIDIKIGDKPVVRKTLDVIRFHSKILRQE